jgi:hypothetical protein
MNTYSSLAAVGEDFDTTDAEYKMAAKLFSQNPRVAQIKTFPCVLTAQVSTFTPNVTSQTVADYNVTINGVEFSFESDSDPTAAEVVTGLKDLINAGDEPVTATGTTTLTLTGDVAGVPFTATGTANMGTSPVTTGNNIADVIQDAVDEDNDWYFLLTDFESSALIMATAEVIEAMTKIYIARSDDADVITNVSTDVASLLEAAGYFRTGLFYTGTAGDYGDSAFVGRLAPYDPGSETWAFKTLSGVTVDGWTDSEVTFLEAKSANYYVRRGGISTTLGGKVAGGEFIDVMRFIDWLTARTQERIFGDLVRNTKIPFTDKGIAIVEAGIRAVLEQGVAAGGIASSQDYTVTVPKSSAVSDNDKALRTLTGVKFTARLAGAVHAVEITGNVTL